MPTYGTDRLFTIVEVTILNQKARKIKGKHITKKKIKYGSQEQVSLFWLSFHRSTVASRIDLSMYQDTVATFSFYPFIK